MGTIVTALLQIQRSALLDDRTPRAGEFKSENVLSKVLSYQSDRLRLDVYMHILCTLKHNSCMMI